MVYTECPSNDKQLIVYEDMYHNLTCGESNENIQLVFNDIIQWIIGWKGSEEGNGRGWKRIRSLDIQEREGAKKCGYPSIGNEVCGI